MRDWHEYLRTQEIKVVAIDAIKPYGDNARINEHAVPAVVKSIKRFGFRNPILVDKDSVIIEGHTRRLAAIELGMQEVPVIYATDLTSDEVDALRIVDNKTAELAGWDMEALAREMERLSDFAFGDFGFDVKSLTDMELDDPGNKEDEYDFEEGGDGRPDVEVRTKPGDLWKLGDHYLMCGDSTSEDDVARLMDGERADCLLTDPPYNVAVEGGTGMTIENDNMSDAAFDAFLAPVFRCADGAMKPGAAFYVFHASSTQKAFEIAMNAAGFKWRQVLVWAKESLVLGRHDYQFNHELCAYGWRDGAAHKWNLDRKQTTVVDLMPNAIMKRKDGNVTLKIGGKMYALKADAVVEEIQGSVIWTPKPTKCDLHPCLDPNCLVMTENGYTPIGEIRKGTKVLSADGRFHDVEVVSRHPYSEDIYEISVTGTNLVDRATHNHPYLVARKKKGGMEVGWVDAEHVKEGDYLMTPFVGFGWDEPIDELDAWCYGLWLAQGSVLTAGGKKAMYPVFALDGRKKWLRDNLVRWGGDKKVSTYKNGEGHGVLVDVFDSRKGAECVRLCGRHASEKRIASEVFGWTEKLRRAFFEGYMAGDGCVISTRGHRHSKSVSRSLATQIKFLAESLGYRAYIYLRQPKMGAEIGGRKFKSLKPIWSTDYYKGSEKMRTRAPFVYNGVKYWLHRVRKVAHKPYSGDVVNLSVKGNHTFQTACGMTHNTMKPIALCRYLMENSTDYGDTVLDLFGGSGTTLIAAERSGRKCRMMELDVKYATVILNRWEAETGKKAELVSSRENS